jgi:acetyl-CoA carboxylase biotin carboxyl carrier protein
MPEIIAGDSIDLGRNVDNDESKLHKITSPMVGTFYSAPEQSAAPLVKVGERLKADTVVCVLEAMKLFNEIEAQVSGEVVGSLVQDGQLVEYGQPLFLVKPE